MTPAELHLRVLTIADHIRENQQSASLRALYALETDVVNALAHRDERREHIATAMLAALMRNGQSCSPQELAQSAYRYADALIEEGTKK